MKRKFFYKYLIILLIGCSKANEQSIAKEELIETYRRNLLKSEDYLENYLVDSSLVYIKENLKDSLKLTEEVKANTYFLYAQALELKNEEEDALRYYMLAKEIYSNQNSSEKEADINYELFSLVDAQNDLTSTTARTYLDSYYDYAAANADAFRLKNAFMGYARLNFNKIDYAKALDYYDKALIKSIKIKDTQAIASITSNKGLIYVNFKKEHDSARIMYKEAVGLYQLINKSDNIFNTTLNIGSSYLDEDRYDEAIKWYQKADSVKVFKYRKKKKKKLYGLMSNAYKGTGDYPNSYNYLVKYLNFKDSIDLVSQNIAISDLETKYQTLEKEKENLELKTANSRNQRYLLGSFGLLIVTAAIGMLLVKNSKKKRLLAEQNEELEKQKFTTLLKEQELLAIDAMVEGQEKERKRIAEDLHDNLGSVLATLKMHFENFKINKSKRRIDENELLGKTETLLDEAYFKVRSIAHAKNAGVIANQGLLMAVKSMADKVSIANNLTIEVVDYGLDKPLENSLEISLFRIIQELITNIIKHANATKASIQITQHIDAINIIVSDNGVGFDKDNSTNAGMGLSNIKTRIEHLHGNIAIDSQKGKGCTVLIDIPL